MKKTDKGCGSGSAPAELSSLPSPNYLASKMCSTLILQGLNKKASYLHKWRNLYKTLKVIFLRGRRLALSGVDQYVAWGLNLLPLSLLPPRHGQICAARLLSQRVYEGASHSNAHLAASITDPRGQHYCLMDLSPGTSVKRDTGEVHTHTHTHTH